MDELDINPRIISAVRKAQLQDYSSILSLSAPDIQRMTKLSINDIHLLKSAVAHKICTLPCTTALHLQHFHIIIWRAGNEQKLMGTYEKPCSENILPTQLDQQSLQLYTNSGPSELYRDHLSLGCPYLDSFLRGGILSRMLTEISGESASGKTQLCLQLCLTVQMPKELGGLEGGAVYICTEDVFPNKRLIQMVMQLKKCKDHAKVKAINFTDNIFIEHAAEISDLYYCLSKKIPVLLARKRVKLVIVDSIAALFRCEHDSCSLQDRAKLMRNIASQLLQLAHQHNIPTVCVNQVSDLISDKTSYNCQRKVTPALGISWANHVNVRLMLMRTNQRLTIQQKNAKGAVIGQLELPIRTMQVLFAPHLPMSLCKYIVDEDGVKGLPS